MTTVTAGGNAVSCTSANACTAVEQHRPAPVVSRWNGVGWTVQSTPAAPPFQTYWLTGVSCTSRAACVLIGFDDTAEDDIDVAAPLAEVWDGSRWSFTRRPPDPAHNTSLDAIAGVSCVSPRVCSAVGYEFVRGGFDVPLIERYS
jgi:hypothetical protein